MIHDGENAARLVAAFEAGLHHGCLVIRDSESDGDISDWEPSAQPWYGDRGSFIFGTQPAIEGLVRCEIWSGMPTGALASTLFAADLDVIGQIEIEDPARVVEMRIGQFRGPLRLTVLVDDMRFPTVVQAVLEAR